jgi:hypothetical protein
MRIAKEGWPLILPAAAVALMALLLGWLVVGVALAVLTIAIAAFFAIPSGKFQPVTGWWFRPLMAESSRSHRLRGVLCSPTR